MQCNAHSASVSFIPCPLNESNQYDAIADFLFFLFWDATPLLFFYFVKFFGTLFFLLGGKHLKIGEKTPKN